MTAQERRQAQIADQLAQRMRRYLADGETETAGRALLIGAASIADLAQNGVPAAEVGDILAFTAGRLVTDSRARPGTQGSDDHG